MLEENNQLFISLTETWLKDHTAAELFIPGYTLFRCDRIRKKKSKRGRLSGGTAIYIRNDLSATTEKILSYSNGVVELLTVFSKKENLCISVIYRQPDNTSGGYPSNSTHFEDAIERLQETLEKSTTTSSNIILCGDFNLPHTSWPDGNPAPGANPDERQMIRHLKSFAQNFFLSQLITDSTHKDGNILDLVLTNNTKLVHNINYNETLQSISHHKIIELTSLYNSPFSISQKITKKFNSKLDALNFFSDKTEWNNIKQELENVNWVKELDNLSPNQMYEKLISICENICELYVPKKSSSFSPYKKQSRQRKLLLRRRRKVNNHLQKYLTQSQRLKYQKELTEIEKNLQRLYKSDSLENERKATKAIKKNSKYFFNYAKKFSKIKTSIGPLLIKELGEYVSDDKGMAETLSKQYSSVFSTPKQNLAEPTVLFENDFNDPNSITDVEFSKQDIIKAIDDISMTAAAGPDGFPAILLKTCKDILCRPLYMLWRKSLDLGITPDLLKQSYIVPMHKGGSHAISANYRPVALTSHIVKVFEKIVRRSVVEFMENKDLFNPSQHGFRAGRSCLSQLLNHYDKVLKLLEEGSNVDVIYLDFSKAFDKLDFGIVLNKLKYMGINGRLGRWIYSFLTGRTQTVLVNGTKSSPSSVLSGVPQGSVIGPLLFLILIGDIDESITSSFLSSFADDTRVAKGIKSVEDSENLQRDLEILYKWALENNMKFNDVKFEVLRYGKDEVLKQQTKYLSNTGQMIGEKSYVKDLGVYMSNTANFQENIFQIIMSTTQLSSWILRTFNSREAEVMLTLWKSLVIPRFDYCSQLYSPSKVSEIQQLELVQRSFLRRINGSSSTNYWQLLHQLNIHSLERRRERYQIIYIWKILEGLVPNLSTASSEIISKENDRRGRTCYQRALYRSSYQQLRSNTLSVRGVKLFNCLPKNIRNIKNCTKEKFKSKLDSFLKQIPDEPQIPGYTASRRADSNSILDMIKFVGQSDAVCTNIHFQATSSAATRWKSEDFGHGT